MSKLDELLDRHGARLQALDDDIVGETIGVAQAVGELRRSLDKLEKLLDERQFEKASSLGYGDITYAFVFLQRTLAGLQSTDQDVQSLISEMAGGLVCAHEDIEADVKSRMPCYRTRDDIAEHETAEWKRENADAVDATNKWVEQNGLPLSKRQPE